MREALITANRRAGAQQGLVTKARKKIANLQAELSRLEQERDDLLSYRQQVEREASEISALLPRLKGRLLQVQQIEQALENLADIKEAVDQQERANGGPSRQSSEDLRRAVERLLERADAVEFFEETVEGIEADRDSDFDLDLDLDLDVDFESKSDLESKSDCQSRFGKSKSECESVSDFKSNAKSSPDSKLDSSPDSDEDSDER